MEKFIKEFSDFLADYRIDVYDAKETGTNSANFSVLMYNKSNEFQVRMALAKAIAEYKKKSENDIVVRNQKFISESDDEIELEFDVVVKNMVKDDARYAGDLEFEAYSDINGKRIDEDEIYFDENSREMISLDEAFDIVKSNAREIDVEENYEKIVEYVKDKDFVEEYRTSKWFELDDSKRKIYFPEEGIDDFKDELFDALKIIPVDVDELYDYADEEDRYRYDRDVRAEENARNRWYELNR